MNKRLISKKVIALLYLTSLASSIANDKPQVTTIINGTDSSLNVDLTVPARAEALIRIRKIQVKFSQDILHKAILNNSIEEIRKAILAGADVNYIKDGKNPLFLAVALAQTNIVELLLENGAKPDEKLIQYAINLNDIRSAYLIAKKCGISFDAKYKGRHGDMQPLLRFALVANDFETSLFLIQNGAAISGDGFEAIFFALNNPKGFELIEEIIGRGYEVNKIWNNPIIYKKANFIELFVKHGANPNQIISRGYGTWTPLMDAISSGNKEAIIALLRAGADVNLKAYPSLNHPNKDLCMLPYTPLLVAVESKKADIVVLLLEHGANITFEFARAMELGYKEVIKVLLEHGATL